MIRRTVVLGLGIMVLASAMVVGKTLYSIFWPPAPKEFVAEESAIEPQEFVEGERAPASYPAPVGGGSDEYSANPGEREAETTAAATQEWEESITEEMRSMIKKFFSSESQEVTKSEKAEEKKEENRPFGGVSFGRATTGSSVTSVTTSGGSSGDSTSSGGGSSGTTINVQPPFFASVTNGGFASGTTGSGFQVTATVGDPLSVVSGTTTPGNYTVLLNSSAQR